MIRINAKATSEGYLGLEYRQNQAKNLWGPVQNENAPLQKKKINNNKTPGNNGTAWNLSWGSSEGGSKQQTPEASLDHRTPLQTYKGSLGCVRRIYRGQSSFEETQKQNKKKASYVALTLCLVLEEASLLSTVIPTLM